MSKNLYVELSLRSKQILKSVVESYLETGAPSGSETILKKVGINISSSSIRSILADLQKEGLLYAPHTSAGRLPTDKGMRFFVDGFFLASDHIYTSSIYAQSDLEASLSSSNQALSIVCVTLIKNDIWNT